MAAPIIKNEPVLVSHLVVWILANVGALVVGHTTLVTAASWSVLSTLLTPILSALLLAAIAYVTRRFTRPVKESNAGN